MGRAPCCSKVGLHKGPWTPKEDALLIKYIQAHGEGQWRSLPKNAGLLRCGKSCRLRWMNYLRPDIKRGNITPNEEDLIVKLHGLLGNRWSLIAKRLPGRTDNEIKNYWNTHLNKRVRNQGTNLNPDKQPSQQVDGEKSANIKKRNANRSKSPLPINEDVDQNGVLFMEIKHENTNEDERDRKPKIHLPKPIRVSPIISLTRNNSNNGSFESNTYMSTASSVSTMSKTNDEVAFDQSEDGILLDMPWVLSTNANMGIDHHHQNGLEDMMLMMGSSSSSGDDVNVDIIHHDHENDNDNDQPFENNLYEEYLQLIKADQYYDIVDDHGGGGDHHNDVDSFTKSFLI